MEALANLMNPALGLRAPPMRALLQDRCGGIGVLHTGKAPRPAPHKGEVVVQVKAAGLDRGTWHLMTGRPYLMRLMGFGLTRPKSRVPGLDLAGTVVAVREGVTRFAPGDEVFGAGMGSFAEYARARVDRLALRPAVLPAEQAAVLGISGMTALQALRDAGRVQAGERVLILGASGGVGTYAVQLAKHLGAHVTGVCSAAKADLVRSLGAERVIDYRAGDVTDARYDLIVDIAGNTPLAVLRRALTPEGRIAFVGGEHGGDLTGGMGRPLGALLRGPFTRQRFTMLMSRENAADLETLARLAASGAIRAVIDRTCRLEQVPAAIEDLEAGRVRGKVAIEVG